ncbi:MAG: hypothetical protein PWQ39_398 [Thermacetogenium sp.]|nr:hypothetical protein [Thermacetogenium sp.]
MLTATQIIYLAHENRINFEEEGTCRLCGGRLHDPIPMEDFGSGNWTDEFLCRDLSSELFCGSCEFVRQGRQALLKGTRVLIASPSGLFKSQGFDGLLEAATRAGEIEYPSVWFVRGGSSSTETQKHILFRSLDAVSYSKNCITITCYGIRIWPLNPMWFSLSVDPARLADDAASLIDRLKKESDGVKNFRKTFFKDEKYLPFRKAFKESPYGILLGNIVLDSVSS